MASRWRGEGREGERRRERCVVVEKSKLSRISIDFQNNIGIQ